MSTRVSGFWGPSPFCSLGNSENKIRIVKNSNAPHLQLTLLNFPLIFQKSKLISIRKVMFVLSKHGGRERLEKGKRLIGP